MKTTLSEWLASVDCKEIVRGQLRFNGYEFDAAKYVQTLVAPEGCRNPGPYTREAIYVVGEVPPFLLKKKSVFTFNGDAREWFLSTYMRKKDFEKADKAYHPLGMSFQISPWTQEEKIDKHEVKPYGRMPVEFIAYEKIVLKMAKKTKGNR